MGLKWRFLNCFGFEEGDNIDDGCKHLDLVAPGSRPSYVNTEY